MRPALRRGLLVAIAAAAAVHAATFLGSGPTDDDFITYRYARHLVEGLGPVFEPGERVEGYTTPGWMLAIAAALSLGLEAPKFSFAASIVASMSGVPRRRRTFAKSTSKTPFETTIPTIMMMPIALLTLIVVFVAASIANTPLTPSGTLNMMTSGSSSDLNCDASTM